MTKPLTILLSLILAGSSAFAGDALADDALVLDDGVDLERAHRIENGVAAGLTASLLTYESVVLIKGAIDTEPSGGLVDLSWLGKGVGYSLGAMAGLGAVSMFGLLIHDAVSSPVADARDTYRAGDHMTATSSLADRGLGDRSKGLRLIAWLDLGLASGLLTYGAIAYPGDHDIGKVNIWVGGTLVLVNATILLHTRKPVATRTYGRFTFGVTPTGVAGVF